MTDQNQKASGDGVVVQSGRDTNINHGLSPQDLKTILDALAGLANQYTAIAKDIFNERIEYLIGRIYHRFTESDANRDAFKDPDFQCTVDDALRAHGRSGDSVVADILVGLIASRSKETTRGRLALTLNQAVQKSAQLTRNEFAELSLIMLFKHFVNNSVQSLPDFAQFLNEQAAPLMPDVSPEQASYSYLLAQGCGSYQQFGNQPLHLLFRLNYLGVLNFGFDLTELSLKVSNTELRKLDETNLIIKCVNDEGRLQLNALNRKHFMSKAVPALSVGTATALWAFFDSRMWTQQQIIENLRPTAPIIYDLFQYWESEIPISRFELNAVGIAIAHANLSRTSSIGIKLSDMIV